MSTLPLHRPTGQSRYLVVGKTGTGKSYLVKAHLRAWLKDGLRVVVLDPKDEYSRGGIVRGGPCAVRLTPAELAADVSVLKRPRLSLAVACGLDPWASARAWSLLYRHLRAAAPCVVVWAELGACLGRADLAAHEWKAVTRARRELGTVATTFREFGIGLVLETQRASHVPTDARSQVSALVAFRQDEPTDLQFLAARTRRPEFARAADLRDRQYLFWSDSPPNDGAPAPH